MHKFPKKHRERLFKEGKDRCMWCNRQFIDPDHLECTLEHIKPLSEGGTWAKDNLDISCACCQGGRFVNKIPYSEQTVTLSTILNNE